MITLIDMVLFLLVVAALCWGVDWTFKTVRLRVKPLVAKLKARAKPTAAKPAKA